MTALKLTTETIHKVDYHDLEVFIRQTYGREFSVLADLESPNDSVHRIVVTADVKDYRYSDRKDELDAFINDGKKGFMLTEVLMTDMCAKKLIPAGIYLIDVCW